MTQFEEIFNNINRIYLVDQNYTREQTIFNEFTGEIIYKPKSLSVKYNLIKSVELFNCKCFILIDNHDKIELKSDHDYNFNLIQKKFNLIYLLLEQIDDTKKWTININWSNSIPVDLSKSNSYIDNIVYKDLQNVQNLFCYS